jgi:hypothetical protein
VQISSASYAASQPLASASHAPKLEKPIEKLADIILADAVRGNQIDIKV